MKRKSIFLYAPIYLALIIPTPGRFVYGFTIFFEMMLLTLVGTLMYSLIKKLHLEKMETVLIMLSIVATTILYRQLLVLVCTEIALTLGFVLYLPPISLFLIGILFNDTEAPLQERLKENLTITGIFSIIGLLFFLVRDLFGYGTFTFIGTNHQIFEKVLFTSDNWAIFSLLASIPGALLLAGLLLYIAIVIRKKIHIVRNTEEGIEE